MVVIVGTTSPITTSPTPTLEQEDLKYCSWFKPLSRLDTDVHPYNVVHCFMDSQYFIFVDIMFHEKLNDTRFCTVVPNDTEMAVTTLNLLDVQA